MGPSRSQSSAGLDDRFPLTVIAAAAGWGVLWCGAALASVVSGHGFPPVRVAAPVIAVTRWGDPSAAWGTPVASWPVYWASTVVVVLAAGTLAVLARRIRSATSGPGADLAALEGVAGRHEARRAAGVQTVLVRGRGLRPSLQAPSVADVGVALGTARGVGCYATVEDSLVVLGPPRSGKGLHLVIPTILDAPGRGGHHQHPPGQPGGHPVRADCAGSGGGVRPAGPGAGLSWRRRGGRRCGGARTRMWRWSGRRR